MTPGPGFGGAAEDGGGPYRVPEDSTETERTPLETGALQTFDVFALIVNKMVGTGIYSAPATIFVLTGQKWLTLVLFLVGFVHTVLSTAMYLDYASVWPYTGGELIYIDEITASKVDYPSAPENPSRQNPGHPHQHNGAPPAGNLHGIELVPRTRPVDTTATAAPDVPGVAIAQRSSTWQRVLGDGLLPYITFSVLFVAIFNSATNSMQTGRMILLAIAANEPASRDVHRDVARLLGVVILTILSLLQYFSARFGRKLNRFLVVIKLLFLLALFITALVALKDPLTTTDMDRHKDWGTVYPVKSKTSFAKALLAVLFSFDGWENATFVAGELPRTGNQKELRKGFWWAVCTVGVTYVLIVTVVLNSLTLDNIRTENVFYAPLLTGNGPAAKQAWAIVGAISSLGSLNSVIYTFSRVKQAIGQAYILPWSSFWKKDDILQRGPSLPDTNTTVDSESIRKTPQGGLILHWALSVAAIAGSSWIPSTIESVSIPGYLQAYAHCFILMVLGCTYHRLRSSQEALTPPTSGPRTMPATKCRQFKPYKWSNKGLVLLRWALVIIYVGFNAAILVINVIPPYLGSDGTDNTFPGWAFLVTVVALVAFSVIIYITIFGGAKRIYRSSSGPGSVRVEREALLKPESKANLLRLAKVACEIEKDRYFNQRLERVYRFGRRWRVRFYVPGDRPATQGQNGQVPGGRAGVDPANREPHPPLTWATFWYWLFGGGRLVDSPDKKFRRWWDEKIGL